jgi:hypothetical protein
VGPERITRRCLRGNIQGVKVEHNGGKIGHLLESINHVKHGETMREERISIVCNDAHPHGQMIDHRIPTGMLLELFSKVITLKAWEDEKGRKGRMLTTSSNPSS